MEGPHKPERARRRSRLGREGGGVTGGGAGKAQQVAQGGADERPGRDGRLAARGHPEPQALGVVDDLADHAVGGDAPVVVGKIFTTMLLTETDSSTRFHE